MARTKGAKNKTKKQDLSIEEKIDPIPAPVQEDKNDGELSTPIKIEIREIIKEVPEPRLEGFALYKALERKGYFQGGMGEYMENPNGIDRVYVPHYTELLTNFTGDPDKLNKMRDAIIRAYIEIQ